MDFGWGNGYVLIPEDHPLHGNNFDDIDIDVHGGITFCELVTDELIKNWGNVSLEDKGMWIIGFDTAHGGDTLKKWPEIRVQQELDHLLNQIKKYNK